MNHFTKLFFIFFTCTISSYAQSISSSIPKKIKKSEMYMFYVHGRIIEEQGIHAVHPEYGAYEYLAILDSLSKYGYNVISNVRPKNADEHIYADKLTKQIDTLLKAGVPGEHIFVVGASKGSYITLLASEKLMNTKINFALLGACYADQDLGEGKLKLCGNFLSFYETSDTWCISCTKLFENQDCVSKFQEVELSTNKGHGVLYKPYSEWITPLMNWAKEVK